MKVGLIDVYGHIYPNLPLMKISAWHKSKGDRVTWYEPFDGLIEECDISELYQEFDSIRIHKELEPWLSTRLSVKPVELRRREDSLN